MPATFSAPNLARIGWKISNQTAIIGMFQRGEISIDQLQSLRTGPMFLAPLKSGENEATTLPQHNIRLIQADAVVNALSTPQLCVSGHIAEIPEEIQQRIISMAASIVKVEMCDFASIFILPGGDVIIETSDKVQRDMFVARILGVVMSLINQLPNLTETGNITSFNIVKSLVALRSRA